MHGMAVMGNLCGVAVDALVLTLGVLDLAVGLGLELGLILIFRYWSFSGVFIGV